MKGIQHGTMGFARCLVTFGSLLAFVGGAPRIGAEEAAKEEPSKPATLDDVAKGVTGLRRDFSDVKKDVDEIKKKQAKEEREDRACPGWVIERGTAETNCPVFVELNGGVELQQADEFSQAFPRVGMRARVKLPEWFAEERTVTGESIAIAAESCPEQAQPGRVSVGSCGWKFVDLDPNEDPRLTVDFVIRPHAYADIALGSVAVSTPKESATPVPTVTAAASADTAGAAPSDQVKVEGKKAWDMKGGFIIDLFDYRLGTRTGKFYEELPARAAARKELTAAQLRLEAATDNYMRWEQTRNESLRLKSNGNAPDVSLEVRLSELKRIWDGNDDLIGAGGKPEKEYRAVARTDIEKAEQAWRTAKDELAKKKAKPAKPETTATTNKAKTTRAKKAANARTAADDDKERKEIEVLEAQVSERETALAALTLHELAWEDVKRARGRTKFYRERYYTEYSPTITLAAVAELGAVSPSSGSSDLLQKHFAGMRVYYRGPDILNGFFLDVGWGSSENLKENTDKRIKFRAHIPVRLSKKENTSVKAFIRFEADSDFRKSADEVKVIMGTAIDFNKILGILGLPDLP